MTTTFDGVPAVFALMHWKKCIDDGEVVLHRCGRGERDRATRRRRAD